MLRSSTQSCQPQELGTTHHLSWETDLQKSEINMGAEKGEGRKPSFVLLGTCISSVKYEIRVTSPARSDEETGYSPRNRRGILGATKAESNQLLF